MPKESENLVVPSSSNEECVSDSDEETNNNNNNNSANRKEDLVYSRKGNRENESLKTYIRKQKIKNEEEKTHNGSQGPNKKKRQVEKVGKKAKKTAEEKAPKKARANNKQGDEEGEEKLVKKMPKSNGEEKKSNAKQKREDGEEEEDEDDKSESSLYQFPHNRIHRIIKSENADSRMSQEAIFMVNKATEKFLEVFCREAYACAFLDRNHYVGYDHLSSVVSKRQRFDFLSDFVPRKVRAEDALAEISKAEEA